MLSPLYQPVHNLSTAVPGPRFWGPLCHFHCAQAVPGSPQPILLGSHVLSPLSPLVHSLSPAVPSPVFWGPLCCPHCLHCCTGCPRQSTAHTSRVFSASPLSPLVHGLSAVPSPAFWGVFNVPSLGLSCPLRCPYCLCFRVGCPHTYLLRSPLSAGIVQTVPFFPNMFPHRYAMISTHLHRPHLSTQSCKDGFVCMR